VVPAPGFGRSRREHAIALFLLGRASGHVVTSLEPRRFLTSFAEPHLLYALPFFAAAAVTIQFLLQMNRMIGANVLGYFAAGVYRWPKAEERIFLFLDLEGSTRLAEALGSARYFELLRRFVDDLTEPVLAAEGEIYQYAGDEVVITWPIEAGRRRAHCVRCFSESARPSLATPSATSASSARCRARGGAARRHGDKEASWATCDSRSSSWATFSIPPRASKSTPSGPASTSWCPALLERLVSARGIVPRAAGARPPG
jgi:hypothetical protein